MKVVSTLGRKRTSKKVRIIVSVDKEIIEKLREWNINRSAIFTEKALELLEELEKQQKIEKMSNNEKKDLQ